MTPAMRPTRTERPAFDVDRLLDSASVLVCCGAGGVGKTTTAAALAVRGSERGRRTVVLTIDPARRLAQALGLTELDNTPRHVEGVTGHLDAMMLDMKRTFDDIVLAHTDAQRADQIFANPFYQALSSSFAGTQEYMAMEKLGQLASAGRWDLIVVDTPPTRSALDFLDAPARLGTFLDGRLLKLLLSPARAGGRAYLKVVGSTVTVFTRLLTRIIGAQVLTDVQQFVAALETMFGGFRERADATYQLLSAPGTAFVVVASPESAALREASYFAERLARDAMPLAGLVLNRVHTVLVDGLTATRALAAAESLQTTGTGESSPLSKTAGLLRLHADRARLADRDARMQERFTGAHPDVPVVAVPALPRDVHDLAGLRLIGARLAGQLGDGEPPAQVAGTGERAD